MKMLRYTIKFGGIAGVIMIISWFVTNQLLGPAEGEPYDFSQGQLLGYLSMLVAFTAVFVGVKSYRDRELDGAMNFKQGLLIGTYMVLVTSVIYVVGWMIYYPNFMADFPDQYMMYQIAQYKDAGISGVVLDTKVAELEEMMEMYKNPVAMAGVTFVEIFPVGFVVAIISALVWRRKG